MSAQKCETNVLGHFVFNYRSMLIDEIALDGLEGIGICTLWQRMEQRISSPLTDKMKCRFWETILSIHDIDLYQLPEPLPKILIRDRFTLVDDESGHLKDPDDYLDGPYEYCPIPNEYGSCKYYSSRKKILSHLLLHVTYDKVLQEYGDTLVLVASLEQRWHALAKHLPITCLLQLSPIQFCILELIGKARENGQMTTGKTNLTNIMKEPKNLFYVRRTLKNLDLIKVLCVTQSLGTKGIKSLLIRLNRFHQPSLLTVPKTGKIHELLEYLKTRPNYMGRIQELVKKGILTTQHSKKLRKRLVNVFEFIDYPTPDGDEPARKKARETPRVLDKKRKYIVISTKSDESSQSEDEVAETPAKYQFKIGISLMRQAYERILESGAKGLSQTELGQMLGVHFYTSRMMCRILKSKKIVREFFEDKGKQRISRFIAVASGSRDAKYMEEKNKFLEYINQSNNTIDTPSTSTLDTVDEQTHEVETDEIKEMGKKHIIEMTASNEKSQEVKAIIESKKGLTLRQLKFGNGVIKIVKEKQCVTGFQTLSNLVGKEINEPPMVSKALKTFLQKLVDAGQIKIFRVKWPGHGSENILNLICAPHIKITDQIVQTKYKEVHVRAMAKKTHVKTEVRDSTTTKPLSMFINPRYMKIQKLHETIIKKTYFDKDVPSISTGTNSAGFLSVADLMPEMTVKFAISNMSNTGIAEIAHLPINDSHFDLKLKDAPSEISHGIMKSKSLKNGLRLNLKALAMYGLIQLIYQPDVQTVDYVNNSLVSFLFYINRNAKIINTSGKWPRQVADINSLEKSYYFETFDDVKNYWKEVHDISIDTTITIAEKRVRKALNPPVRREQNVESFDDGNRYGDGNGPCGFDSCFYMEIPRLWRAYYVRHSVSPSTVTLSKKIPQIKTQKLAKSKKPKKIKKKATKINPIMKIKTTKGRKRIPETTVTWTEEEDHMVMMCQAAVTIASPSSQPGCLRVRNMVAKDILSINDPKKTQSICHKRMIMLQQNSSLMHEKDSLLNEMRRRRNLIYKYEGLIKKLRLRHITNMSKFIHEARLPMLELVWSIWQVSQSGSYNLKMPCVALDVDSFKDNFNIVTATSNKLFNLYKSPELPMLREGVFLTIMLTLNGEVKSESAKKIYSIFKTYPENSLRIVVDQLRKCGAVSAKEKLFNNQLHRLHLEDIVQSAYKISIHYQRRWISRLNSEYAESLSKVIRADFPTSNIRGSAEINCIFCELHGSNVLDVITSTKPVIVDASGTSHGDESINANEVETKHKLKSGSVTWEKKAGVTWDGKSVSSLYTIPDFESILQDMAKSAVVFINDDQEYDLSDPIIRILQEEGEKGTSFKNLQEITGYDDKELAIRLSKLESENIAKRVGSNNNMLILVKYIDNWALQMENKHVIVLPWFNIDIGIRYDIFLSWAGVIVNKIFEHPGCSISFISDIFELITGRAVQDVCMFLAKCDVIKLQIVRSQEADLFCDQDEMPETSDFHPYESIENILAYPVKNTVTKYVYLRKIMLEHYFTDKVV